MRNHLIKLTTRPLLSYLAVGVLVVVALESRLFMKSILGLSNIYQTFYLAVIISALLGGPFTGIFATFLSALAASYYLIEPVGSFHIQNVADLWGMVIFLLNCAVISIMTALMQQSRARAIKAETEITLATERRKGEEAALKLAAIVESSDDAIIGKTLDGKITSWNSGAEKIYGYFTEEAIGRPISILIPSGYPDEMPMLLEKIAKGESVAHYETVRMRKDGALINVSLTISPVRNTSNNIVGASIIAKDITERKRTEAERERLFDELKQALANVKTLTGMLPMCARCKKIRDDEGYWNEVASYISSHSEVSFTHGLCPECIKKLYPDYYERLSGKTN